MRYGLSEEAINSICLVLSHCLHLEKAVLFGSKAKGNFKPGSDVDLALVGSRLIQRDLHHLYGKLDDLPLPYEFSLVLLDKNIDPAVAAHIKRVGSVLYKKSAEIEVGSDVEKRDAVRPRVEKLTRYGVANGDSGVTAYESKADSIVVQFRDESAYLYTYASTGQRHVETMKKLAAQGEGLTTYINQNVHDNFAAKLS